MPPLNRARLKTPEGLESLERTLVALIALHSLVVGLFLTFATDWGARFGGFPSPVPLFFPRQAGAFHFVVAGVYLVEYFVYRGVLTLVMTKAIAVVFLGIVTFACPVSEVMAVEPDSVPTSALNVTGIPTSRLPLVSDTTAVIAEDPPDAATRLGLALT